MTDTFRRPRTPLTSKQRRERLEMLLRTENGAITNALRVFARRMTEAAADASADHQAGKNNPNVKTAQDGSLLTNNGLLQSARIFADEAAKATRIADEIDYLLDDSGDGDDD